MLTNKMHTFLFNVLIQFFVSSTCFEHACVHHTRVGTLIVATIYLQLIQNRYMFRSFTVLQCSHQHCVQPVASDVEVFSSACCVDSSNGAVYRLKNLWNSSEANATKWFLHLRNQVEVTRA